MEFPDDEDSREFLKHAEEEMAPMLRASAASISLVPSDHGDAKFWVELGASIMFEKPIILVVSPGRSMPQKLQHIADEIIVLPEDGTIGPEVAEEIEAAMRRIVGR